MGAGVAAGARATIVSGAGEGVGAVAGATTCVASGAAAGIAALAAVAAGAAAALSSGILNGLLFFSRSCVSALTRSLRLCAAWNASASAVSA